MILYSQAQYYPNGYSKLDRKNVTKFKKFTMQIA